jgi:hypothetical protein
LTSFLVSLGNHCACVHFVTSTKGGRLQGQFDEAGIDTSCRRRDADTDGLSKSSKNSGSGSLPRPSVNDGRPRTEIEDYDLPRLARILRVRRTLPEQNWCNCPQ